MSGYENSNVPAFLRAQRELKEQGWDIIIPVDIDHPQSWPEGSTWIDYLSADLKLVVDVAHGIILLPGWPESKGARLEAMAALLNDKEFYEYGHPMRKLEPVTVLQKIYNSTWQKITTSPPLRVVLQPNLKYAVLDSNTKQTP